MPLPLRLYGERVEVHSKATVRAGQAALNLLDRLAQTNPHARFLDRENREYAFLPTTSRDGYTGGRMVRTLKQYANVRKEMERTRDRFELGGFPIALNFPDGDIARGKIYIRFSGKPIYPVIDVTLGTYRYEYGGIEPGPHANDFIIKEFTDNGDRIERQEINSSDKFHKTQQELLRELGFRLSSRWANYYPKGRAQLNYPPEGFEWLKQRLICWDLDNTLGDFEEVAREAGGYYIEQAKVKIRHGIKNVLEQLSDRAFVHVVTTSTEKRYADIAIKRSGLSGHFKYISARDEVSLVGEKHYKPIAKMFGLSPEEVAARMVVIGDRTLDQAFDMSVLFIEDENSVKRDARVLWEILDAVDAEGDGNLARGHKRLFERGAKGAADNRRVVKDLRRVDLENGIGFSLGHRVVYCSRHRGESMESPVILNIEAPAEYDRGMEEVSA